MNKYINAKPGMKWSLTELGFEDGRIRNKYSDNYPNRAQYEKQVPERWVKEGYVVEVPK